MADSRKECFHCGLPVPPGIDIVQRVMDEDRPMCCHGCQAVAATVVAAGLEDFYRRRTELPLKRADSVPDFLSNAPRYDDPRIRAAFVETGSDDVCTTSLLIGGVTCAACCWLVERQLNRSPGVTRARVNYSTQRASVSWDPSRTQLSDILRQVARIGYSAQPYDPRIREQASRRERNRFILRIAIAGVFGMQLMMIATALYFGEAGGIADEYRELFRWLSLFLTLPVVGYCAYPFAVGALRDLKNGQPGMDTLVTLGLGVAFAGSVWATVTSQGATYYESVAMFVFLLLCARFLEAMARHRNASTLEALNDALPDTAQRRTRSEEWESVMAEQLHPGDIVSVQPGDRFPADAVLIEGVTSADESLLTGESLPVAKGAGAELLAGSINIEQPVKAKVSRSRTSSTVSRIARLAEEAQNHKPHIAGTAESIASWFILGVIGLAVVTGIYWYRVDEAEWLAIVISVLVVTCPCALSLAVPAALTAAVNRLTALGMIPVTPAAMEKLPVIDEFVMDKTGTLTEGRMRLKDTHLLKDMERQSVVQIAASLNHSSHHPVGKCLREANVLPQFKVDRLTQGAGGLSGFIDGAQYHVGNAAYLSRVSSHRPNDTGSATCAWLASDKELLARFEFEDRLRTGARELVQGLKEVGVKVRICSGDREPAVAALAAELGIETWQGGMTPDDKLSVVRALRESGSVVAAAGDGLNDAPVLAAADLSIAMGHGADLTRTNADLVLLNDSLSSLLEGLRSGRRTRRVIHENFAWAIGYNLLALPAATIGMVPPWLAAIGMSVSSLIVVLNALKLNPRIGKKSRATSGDLRPVFS